MFKKQADTPFAIDQSMIGKLNVYFHLIVQIFTSLILFDCAWWSKFNSIFNWIWLLDVHFDILGLITCVIYSLSLLIRFVNNQEIAWLIHWVDWKMQQIAIPNYDWVKIFKFVKGKNTKSYTTKGILSEEMKESL